jgi:hypothetical protein
MSGEMLLAISYGSVMILGGSFIWWHIKNYYDD